MANYEIRELEFLCWSSYAGHANPVLHRGAQRGRLPCKRAKRVEVGVLQNDLPTGGSYIGEKKRVFRSSYQYTLG
jgi:hypothetical protein